ncbi:MAG: alpha/beta hydrolase [Acidobacteriia bacterium]|nr:alpha/beta hydrolase [Terriglobia bacterium]
MPTELIQIDGLSIRYKSAGAGPPVLLLHGWGASMETFEPLFQALSHAFRAVVLDLPGHGQSSLPPQPWHVSNYLDLVLKFMDATGLDQPHILAHSFGGRITIKLASAHPHRAGKLLLTAAAGIPPRQSLRTRVRKVLGATAGKLQRTARTSLPASEPLIRNINARLLPKLASRDYLQAGPLRETLINVVSEDLTSYLASIQSPTLLLWGDHDRETPLSSAETMASLIPNSELIVLPGAGHFPFLDQMNKFHMRALRFFREAA